MALRQYRHFLKKLTKTEGRIFLYFHLSNDDINNIPNFYYAVGALQILEMAKDFRDTIDPYKTKRHILVDLAIGPLIGLLNLLLGAILLISQSLGMVIGILIVFVQKLLELEPLTAFYCIGYGIYEGMGGIFAGAMQVFRGVTALAATPLLWLRIPLRCILSWCKEWQRFEDNAGLKRCLSEGEEILKKPLTDETINSINEIIQYLNYKAIKAHSWGQKSELPSYNIIPHIDQNNKAQSMSIDKQQNELFETVLDQLTHVNLKCEENTKKTIHAYFNLFKPLTSNPESFENSACGELGGITI